MNQKYTLVHDDFIHFNYEDETRYKHQVKLFRIKALQDFNDVKTGDLGGYIESYENLSQNGDCWVYDEGMVYGLSEVSHQAKVKNKAKVGGHAKILNNTIISGTSFISGFSEIKGNAQVSGNTTVTAFSIIKDYASVNGNLIISGSANIFDKARISGDFCVSDKAYLGGELQINSMTDFVTMGVFYPDQPCDLSVCANTVTLARNYVAIAPPKYWDSYIFKGTSTEFRHMVENQKQSNYQMVINVLDSLSW